MVTAVTWEMTRMIDRRIALAVLAIAVLPLSGCKIVQIADQEAAAPAGFDAAGYAEGIWADQALPYFSETARPVADVVPAIMADLEGAGTEFGYRSGEGSPWSFVVNGTGEVTAKNTESRAGTLEVAIEGMTEPLVLQIGPVIRGNAVRDALPFVSFKDFVNQLEYANAGKALTALAFEGIADSAEAVAVGDIVSFTGTIAVSRAGDDVLVTPISLEVAP
jgi:predicted lipoprotein